jgi:hypothetical protein
VLCILGPWLVGTAALPAAGAELTEEAMACLACHGQRGLSITFASGETLPAFVDGKKFSSSMHGTQDCSTCHEGFSAQEHPHREFKSREQYATRSSAACRQCHSDDQLKRASIHASFASAKGGAPACSNCHNPHTITTAIHGKQTLTENDYCLKCHQHAMGITLRNGAHVSLKVDAAALEGSVHAKLACFDCHFGFSSSQHPKRNFNTPRDFSIAQSEACRRCHFDKYTKTLESIHYSILSQGNLQAPVCTDCHGSHTVVQARADKLKSSKRCGRCHTEIFATYTKSVHGNALVEENNFDVPICTDCHTAHTIMGAHSQDYTDKVPEICGKCHGDATLMNKYGLYPGVVNSYLQDFHGVTLKLYRSQKNGGSGKTVPSRKAIATCVDCHGIHDITKTTGPTSNLVKGRLIKRCQKCHPGASEEFPDAWLSHYEPSLRHSPLVFLINLTYKVFIPFMLVGLILQILLHVWRYAVNR